LLDKVEVSSADMLAYINQLKYKKLLAYINQLKYKAYINQLKIKSISMFFYIIFY